MIDDLILDDILVETTAIFTDGDTVDSLFAKSALCESKADTAKLLHGAVKAGYLVRSEAGCYCRATSTPSPDCPGVVCALLPDVEPAVPKRPPRKTPVRAPSSEKFGELARTTMAGRIAYALYSQKDKFLSIDEISQALSGNSRISGLLKDLCERNYAYMRYTKTSITYRWSDTFDYPFPKRLAADANLLANLT